MSTLQKVHSTWLCDCLDATARPGTHVTLYKASCGPLVGQRTVASRYYLVT